MGVRERFDAKQKSKKEDNKNNAFSGVRKRFEEKETKFNLESTIGFDTFESDLNTIGSTVFDAYNGWQTAETMQNTKVSAQKLYDRIGAYEEYRTKYGKDTLPDLSELYNTYETALEGWDDRTALYGNYKNAEAFDKAVKQEQLSQKFTGLSYADVQYQAAHKYAEGSDEYNYLKNYTQYSTADDFDRAIKGTEWIDNIVAKQKEFSAKIKSIENRKETFESLSRGVPVPQMFDDEIAVVNKEYDEYAKSIGFDNADALNEYINGKLAYRKDLEQAKNIYLLDNGPIDDYKHLEQNEDFAEHSKYIPSYDESSGEHFLQGDTKYEYINNTEDIRDYVKMSAAGAGSKDGYAEDGLNLLRENEVAYYNYLKYWDDRNGTKNADKFIKDMEDALQKRVSDERAENREKMLENPFMATAFTLTSPIATIAGGMGNIIASGKEIITGSGYNPYDPLREISNANAHGREVVGKNIVEATEGFELFGQNIPSFLYNTGMSILDTTVGGATMGPAYTLLMGTNAYQQRAKELTEQGYDSATVQGLAIVSGALEAAFEYAQFDHLIKLKDADSISKVLYNAFASQGNVEGLEEFCTSLGTMIAENAFLGEDSTYNKMYKDLLARGYSEKEANTEVAKAMASELGWSYAGGYISGSTLGGGTSTFQYVGNSKAGAEIRQAEQIGNVFDMANNPEIAEAYDTYTRYANKGVNADNITNAQVGNLYNTARSEATMGFNSAYKDMNRAKGVIDKQKAIRESETSSEAKKGRAEAKLDKAISKYTDAQTRMGKYGETLSKVSTIGDSVVETNVKKAIEKHDAEVKAKHEAEVKKLSSGVETSVISKTDKAIEIKGIKDRDTLITNEGEVAFKDVELSDNDARLFSYARGMASDEASLYYEQYDGKADVEQYTNDFNRAVYYAKHSGFTENYILEHKGSLSGEQVSAIYKNTVMAEARVKEAEHNKLISTTANNTPYTGYIDDSIFDYKNTSTSGKINWNSLNQRQKNSVDFLKVFAAKSGMNLVFTPYSKTSNGAFDIKDNTIYVSAYAGILFEKNKLRDSIIPTASHEITHWMEEKSPELYVKLKDTVLDALEVAMGKSQAELISDEIARLDRTHKDKKHTEKDAINEIVARACEDMLSMSKEGRKLFDSMTEEEKKTFVGKVKEILENLMKWIDDFLSSYKSETKEARALQNYKEKLQEISKIWDEMLVRSIEVNQALEKADVFGHLENGISADGTTIVGENNLQMSDKTYNEGGRDFLINWLEGQKDLSDEDKQNIVEQTDRVAEIMRAIDRGGEIPEYSRWANLEVVKDENGEKVLSVIVKNGDYAMNIDFSQVCKKRVALNAVLNKMVQSGDLNVFTLSETDVSELNAIIKEYEFEIACALCFVDSKRYRVGAWADSFCEGSDEKKSGKTVHKYGFNEMVRSLIPEGSNIKVDEFNFTNRAIKNQPKKNLLSDAKDTDLDFSLIDSIMANNDSKSAQYRYAKAIKENPDIRKILNSAEIISSIGLDAIRLESPKLYGLINGHQGTAKPKFAHDVVAYGNDVLKASNFTPEKAKMVGGVRCQSFSDFMAVMVVDYAQFVSELAAKKLTAHSYTKEPLFVKLFGLTGMKINMSLVPKAIEMTPEQQKQFAILKDKNANKKSKAYKDALAEYEKLSENAGLDENGNYIWEDESFPYDIAMEIVVDKKYSKNCGTIAVGISNKHIKKLLADDRISMVIPYHKSGLNHEVAMMRDIALYKDYTDVQNTRDKATGKKLEKGQADFDFYGDLYGKDGKEGTHDPKQTAQNYLKWCYENNYIPKFDDFMLDDNYYKLLIDFRVYDVDGTYTEQQPVQTIYPSNEEFKDLILNGVKDKNGKVYGGLKQQQSTSDRLDAESQQIIDEYKKRLKEKYGEDVLQHSDKDNANLVEVEIDLSDNNELATRIAGLQGAKKYKTIRDYIIESVGEDEFVLSDGIKAKVDKSDALHIANKSANRKIAYISKINELIKKAKLYSVATNVVHNKFTEFRYYKANVKFGDEIYPIYLNVGKAKNGDGYHLYDITKKIGDFAKHKDALERVNKDLRSEIESPNNNYTQNKGKINDKTVNNDNLQHSDKDSDGDILTNEQIVFFKDSEARDAEGRLMKLYHGTPNGSFTEFRMGDGTHSSLMSAYGAGYYFDSVEASAKRYTKLVNKRGVATKPKVYKVYLNVTNPLKITDGVKRISKEQLAQIISRGNYQWFFTDWMPFALKNRLGKSKEEIQKLPRDEVINHWSEMIVERAYSDADILCEMVRAYKGDLILSAMKDVLGYDGAVYKDKYGEVWVAWDSNQIKSVDNTNPTLSNDIQYSDKDDSSVYDLMGETGSIVKENKKLGEDVGRLKEIIGTEEVDNKKFLSLANYMKKISGSTMDSAKLGKMLKEAYTSMQKSGTLSWTDVVMNTHHIATALMTEDLGVSVDYFKRVMQEIRKDKISLSAEQRARVEEQFGNYGNFHKYVFGRMNVTNDGKPLTEVWGNWAKIYPSLFDGNLQGAEQIDALIEAVDILKSTSNMMEEYERAEAIRHLSTELYNQFWNVAAESSTSDQAKAYKAEHKAVMEDLRKGYEQRQKALVVHPTGETALKYESILKKAKETKRKEVAEAKERGRERLSMYKENAERKTKIQKITSNALYLNEMLVKNSKDKHIPEAMKGAVTELLQAIDFSSKRLLKGGEPTQRDISLEKALGHLKDAITEGSQEIGDMLDEMYGSGIDDLTKELVKSVDGHMALIEGQVFTLNEMSLDDLKKLDTIVQIMKQTVNNVNKFHVAQYNRGVQALGVRSTEEIDSRKKVFKDNNKHFEKLKTHTYWNNLNPFYAFKNLGEASQRIFTALQDGQDKLAFLSKEVIDFAKSVYSAKDYDKWSDTYFDFEIPQLNGKVAKFSMNVPQIMSLYCVIKQEDARRHILYGNENGDGGGITIVETDKKEAVRNNIRLTEADLNSIIAKLDNVKNNNGNKSAKSVADELQEFMCRRGADLGNEISMARWGINSFAITNYFPIKVSEGSVPIKNDAPGVNSTSMLELLNMSFTHARNHFAKQSVEIGDVFDVFANHMSNMVRYNAMALPILDMYKWMNCRGVDLYGTEYSVQTSIKNTFGDESWKYFSTLLKDISGGTKKATRDKFLVKFFKNAKVAKVAANLRVALLQFTSYVRAGAVMDNKYLLKALAHKPKSSKAKEHSGIALWKSMGYYDTDITRGLTEQIKHTSTIKDKLIEWSLKGAEKADEITWGYLWNACELEIRETRKDLEVGSKEFNDAVALRLREVIYRTQVVDSMLTRSQMMRSPDGWDKVLTTFASENTLSFNLAMDAFTSYELDKRSVGKEKANEKNNKYIRKVITAYIITNVVTATLQSLFDAFRDYDEDEKDEEYWMKLMLTNFASNSSVLGKTPLGNIILSVLQGFTPARMDVDWLNSFVKTGKQVYKLFTGEGNSEKAVRNALKTLSDSTGIAVYNVYRDIFALYKMFADD